MDAERWQRLSPMLDALLELELPARAASLQSLREDDPQLADELEKLLALEDEADDFLSEPLIPPRPGVAPGVMVGPYRLVRMLAEGGMGQVWLARRADGLYQRRVALKLLRPGLADPSLRLRFTRERQILARLEHPHIAHLLDAGISSDQQPYLALEYVEGEPITDWCRSRNPSVEMRIRLFMQICAAVSHAHTNLIVHRDLKPSNILVTPLDEVRLLDFGIAKLLDTPDSPENTRTGLRTFTLHYAAPEQIRGEPVTTMTDVYSLGVVLYELLTDHKPYLLKRPSDAQWEDAILSVDPVRPSLLIQRDIAGSDDPQGLRRRMHQVAGDLDNIVLKTLSKPPEQRYPSVEALSLDLQRWLDGKPVLARPQSLAYRARKYIWRHRWALSSAAVVTLVLVGALGVVTWQARQALEESARAQALQNFVVGLFEHAGDLQPQASLDLRELLETGVQRGEDELVRQPVARAELLGLIARLRLGLGDYEEALDLLRRQSTIIAGVDDPPASLRMQAAIDLGRAQHLMGKQQDCVDTMRQQQRLASGEEQRVPVQASDFYSQLGRCHRALGEQQTAQLLFQRSLALRRNTRGNDAGVVENLADLAILKVDGGDEASALREMRGALALLRGSVGERHPLAIDILRRLCAMERARGDIDQAGRDCVAALSLALELQGPQHHATIDARRQLAAIHVDQGRLAEAEIEFRESLAWLVSRLGTEHQDVARAYNSVAIVAWERGEFDRAVHYMERTVEIWRKTASPGTLSNGLFNLAMVLHGIGRSAEARPLLEESLQLRRDVYGERHGIVGVSLRLLGEIDAALGDGAAAQHHLRQAVALTREGYGATHLQTRRAEIELSRFLALQGNVESLLQLDRLGDQPQDDSELRKLAWRARGYAAQVRCGDGQRTAAQASLTALVTTARQAQPEGGTIVREIEAIARDCSPQLARR